MICTIVRPTQAGPCCSCSTNPSYPVDHPFSIDQFNRAFIAMFRVTAGETWVESLPKDDADGSVNWQVMSV